MRSTEGGEQETILCHRPFSPGMSLRLTSTPRFPRVAVASPSTQPQGSSPSLGHTPGHPTDNPGLKGQHVLCTEHMRAEGCGFRASTWTQEPRPGPANHPDHSQHSKRGRMQKAIAGWESENLKISYPEQGFLIKWSSSGLCFLNEAAMCGLREPSAQQAPGQVCG